MCQGENYKCFLPLSQHLISALTQDPEAAEEEECAGLSVSGVYFICPLTGATVKKDKREAHIREAILSVSGSSAKHRLPPALPLNLLSALDPQR